MEPLEMAQNFTKIKVHHLSVFYLAENGKPGSNPPTTFRDQLLLRSKSQIIASGAMTLVAPMLDKLLQINPADIRLA